MNGEKTVSRRRVLQRGAAISGGVGAVSLFARNARAQSDEYTVTQIYLPDGSAAGLEGAACTVSSDDSTSRTWCWVYTDPYFPVTTDLSGEGIDDAAVRSPAVRFWGDELVERIPFQRGDRFVVTEDRGSCCCFLGTDPDFRTVHIELQSE